MPKRKRLKVVWICQLNNPFVARKLGVEEGFEIGSWITQYAKIFKNSDAADIHVISPYTGINKNRTFRDKNITYHFISNSQLRVPVWLKNTLYYSKMDWLKKMLNPYLLIKHSWLNSEINKIVSNINPDLIHLVGAENAINASSVFQFKGRYNVFITIQAFMNYTTLTGVGVKLSKKTEIEIFKTFDNYGIMYESMAEFIKKYNPNASFNIYKLPPCKPQVFSLPENEKVYDIIFFARTVKEKGIEDLLEALPLVKEQIENVRLAVVGSVAEPYLDSLIAKASALGVRENVDFIGPQDRIEDVHKIAVKSRITVLPTWNDAMPGTILESMQMGIPCITYPTGGLPTLGDTVVFVEKRNITQLALEIVKLLKDETARNNLARKARDHVKERWSDDAVLDSLLDNYYEVVGSDIGNN